jgi:hypothetical protein
MIVQAGQSNQGSILTALTSFANVNVVNMRQPALEEA